MEDYNKVIYVINGILAIGFWLLFILFAPNVINWISGDSGFTIQVVTAFVYLFAAIVLAIYTIRKKGIYYKNAL